MVGEVDNVSGCNIKPVNKSRAHNQPIGQMDCPALLTGLTSQGCRLFSHSSPYWQNPVGETVHKRHQNGIEPAATIAHGELMQAELELM